MQKYSEFVVSIKNNAYICNGNKALRHFGIYYI